jgi:hypothetical protein
MINKVFDFRRKYPFRHTRRPPVSKAGRPSCVRLKVEELEGRLLLNCAVSIVGGQLTANCDTQPNVVTLDHSGSTTTLNGVDFADSTFSSIRINGGNGGTTENIRATVRPVSIMNTGLNDPINVGDTSGSVQGIQAMLTLENPPDVNFVSVDDSGDTNPQTVTLDSVSIGGSDYGRLSGLAPAPIVYKAIDTDRITVRTGSGGVTLHATNINIVFTRLVADESGANTLVGDNPANMFAILGSDGGILASPGFHNGPISYSGFQNLSGGPGTTLFDFDDGATVSGNIDGGTGLSTLSYASYQTSVIVNLQTSTATGVGGAVSNIQSVIGGDGGGDFGLYNLLVGNGGNVLIGGNGRRNLLIAGGTASTLQGGGGEDLLIGGTTAYDTESDNASLIAIMSEWARTDEDYATRVGNLTSGSGVPLLDATTVTGNGGGNTLLGGRGLDLFYGDRVNDATDWNPDTETFIDI